MPLTTSTPGSDPVDGPAVDGAPRTIEDRLGHRFADPDLLELALRHRSWCSEHGGVLSNERLEFLGDAVLGVVVTDHLYRSDPERPEGVLARCRAELVNAVALAGVAREIDLGASLRLGRGEDQTGGRNKTSILADGLEALIGAVYLDGGVEAATEVVLRLFGDRIDAVLRGSVDSDAKSRLQELAAQFGGEPPRYRLTEEGPEHDKRFTARVEVAGCAGTGVGRTKKEAEQVAARGAAAELLARFAAGDQPGGGPPDDTRSTAPVDPIQTGGHCA
jgi:ribonuclease-3